MEDTKKSSPFIFFLTLEDRLPTAFYIFDRFFKQKGLILVPVKLDQLQTLTAASEQLMNFVLASVTDMREYQIYQEKIRDRLKYLLKSKRFTFIHLSSFSKLNDQSLYTLYQRYYFIKYPVHAKDLVEIISQQYLLKNDSQLRWPGGRRSKLTIGEI